MEPIPESDGDILHCADFLKTLPTAVIVVPPADKGHFVIPPHASSESEQQQQQLLLDTETLSSGGADWGGGDDERSRTIYKSRVFFHLPITSDEGLFTIARGQYSSGPIKYVLEERQASKDSPSDDGAQRIIEDPSKSSSSSSSSPQVIEVEVTARWNDKDLLKSSKVCALAKNSNSTRHHTERGIGIYTPSHEVRGAYRHLSFETIIRIPPKGLVALKTLSLQGPMFAPVDIDLPSVSFGHASFNTSNGSIYARSMLKSSTIEMKTSNGAIEGNFSVSDKLLLTSSNGRIDAHVDLVKEDSEDAQSDIEIEAHTTNGNAHVNYKKHPQGVVLASSVKTTNGDAIVTHQPAFEGTFSVSLRIFFSLN